MKDFFLQYFLNLWIYGSQAMVLFFAGRKLWVYYETNREIKAAQRIQKQIEAKFDAGFDRTADIRRERAS